MSKRVSFSELLRERKQRKAAKAARAKMYNRLALGKGELKSTQKARRKRMEASVIKVVRAKVEQRDAQRGGCRLRHLGGCEGPLEWAHFEEYKRFKTSRQDPEKRHTTKGTFMACRRHHKMYDANKFGLTAIPVSAGCDGELQVVWFIPFTGEAK